MYVWLCEAPFEQYDALSRRRVCTVCVCASEGERSEKEPLRAASHARLSTLLAVPLARAQKIKIKRNFSRKVQKVITVECRERESRKSQNWCNIWNKMGCGLHQVKSYPNLSFTTTLSHYSCEPWTWSQWYSRKKKESVHIHGILTLVYSTGMVQNETIKCLIT